MEPLIVKQENLDLENTERGGMTYPRRVNAPTTYSVLSAKKRMRVISNGEEINGMPSSGFVPRKSVNSPDKTMSPIDQQEGSMVGCEIVFKLSFIEPFDKELRIQSQSCLQSKHRKLQM